MKTTHDVIMASMQLQGHLNQLRPGLNGNHFADKTFRCIFMNENFCILIKISLKFVPYGPIDNKPALV